MAGLAGIFALLHVTRQSLLTRLAQQLDAFIVSKNAG